MRRVGRMVLNRNPQNFFAETEQVAFHLGNLVPGIEVTNDPLLQGRLFSYLDTQLLRLGGPNFHEIPINKPIARVANHQQDGFHRDTINTGVANYHPNSIGGGCPFLAGQAGFVHRREPVAGEIVRARSESFRDHFSQATMFYRSQSAVERQHIVEALSFELAKVTRKPIRQRMLGILREIDPGLAQAVSAHIGVPVPSDPVTVPPGTSAPGPRTDNGGITVSPALSLENQPKELIATRKVAMLVADGFDGEAAKTVRAELVRRGTVVEVVAPVLGPATPAAGAPLEADKTLKTASSVFYDAVFVPGGAASVAALQQSGDAVLFVREAFKHGKPIAAAGGAVDLLVLALLGKAMLAGEASGGADVVSDQGLVSARADVAVSKLAETFCEAIAKHRHWDRSVESVPA